MQLPPVEDVLPLAPLQEGLLFHSLYEPESTGLYLTQTTIRLVGELAPERLEKAVATLLGRHPNLRAMFRYRATGEPVQLIRRDATPTWATVDAADTEGAQQAVEDDWRRGVDIGGDSLLRFTLIREDDTHHVLVITAHHLLMDGWSEMLLLRELLQLYVTGGGARDVPPPPAFRNYLDWLATRDAVESTDRWRAALSGLDRPTLVAPHAGTAGPEPVDTTVELTADATAAVRALARACGATLNTVLQAAWAVVLGHRTGGDDVVFGTTVSVRPAELDGAEDMIGLLINTVPVRATLRPGDTFRDVTERIRDQRADLLEHDHVRLADIQQQTGVSSALFDTNVVFDNFPMNDYELGVDTGDLKLESFTYRDTSHYPLTLVVEPRECMELRLHYRPDLFDAAEMTRWLGRLAHLLASVSADPDRPLAHVDLLDAAERQLVLSQWNHTVAPLADAFLPRMFEEQVRRTPDAPALSAAGRTLTYAELDRAANQLAHHLVGAGVRPEDRVAILMRRTVEAVVAMLAVAKAGGAYVPVDPTYPADRIAYMLDDADPRLVLREDDPAVDGPQHAPDVVITAHTPLYVIYTSGSTGRPKGVVVEHGSIGAYLTRSRAVYPATAGSSLVHSPLSFDLTVTALFTPLISGGHVTLADLDERWPGPRPTFMKITPSHLPLLTSLPDVCSPAQTLVAGGERLTGEALNRWRQRHPGATVYNVYGATELTINCAEHEVAPGDSVGDGAVSIGTPYRSTRMYVLDSRLNPVPPGVTGEFYVAGTHLARGYHDRRSLTAQRFLPDPYGPPGTRMYRTGDLGRWRPDGELEFAGRADTQIKLRGHRIEAGEIESTLLAHPDITQAAVVLREDRPGDHRLVAYVVTTTGTTPDTLHQHLTRHLPDHMIPSAVIALTDLPRTVNGKLDRAALPAPVHSATPTSVAPRTPREEILCGLFAAVLDVPAVGVDDNFFTLGGHSLLAIRLVSRARAIFGRELAVRNLFDTPTVAALAARLGNADAARAPVTARERPARLPLSSGQRGLWFLEQVSGPNPTYNVPLAARLLGPLDRAALRQALLDVVDRHESLRTLIAEDGEGPYQKVLGAGDAPVAFDVVDIDPDRVADELSAASRYAFDTARELPLRAWLFASGPDAHVLLVLIHHIACDGVAMLVLGRDLATAYAARTEGTAPDWASPPVQYADFALWQHTVLGDENDGGSILFRQLEWWKENLRELPAEIRLPADRRRPSTPSEACGSIRFEVPADLHERLTGLARAHGVTPFMVVQSALAALLSRLGAGDDIPIGVPVTGRTDEALADLVGYLINSLVLRNDLRGDPTLAQLLARTRENDLAAYSNQDLPFEALVEALNPPRVANRNPLFQVRLVFNEDKERAAVRALRAMPGIEVTVEEIDSPLAKFDLLFRFVERGDPPAVDAGLDAVLEYDPDLFDASTAQSLTGRLLLVLRTMADDVHRRLSDVDVLLPAERRALLPDWNDVDRPVQEAFLPRMFEEQVRRTPDAPALSAGWQTLTYRELDRRADRLAHYLIEHGVGPQDTVAIVLPRGIDAVVAMLAVMKAGGAYVPVDPTFPAERIAYMLDDAQPRLVLRDGDPALDSAAVDGPDHAPDVTVTAHTPAYVIYTSGSTGRPKGVVVEHGSVGAYLTRSRTAYPATAGSSLVHSPLSFDLTVTALFTPLVSGGHVMLGELAEDALPGRRPTFMKVTPSHLPLLNSLPDNASPSQTLVIGGEPLTAEALREWRRRHPDVTVVNAFGPTELTVNCADHVIRPGDPVPDGPVPFGRPFPNTRAYVLDDRLNLVPPGITGELYVTGVPLARGYLNRPGLTAGRFVACPFTGAGPGAGARMYRTGDLARWRTDGELEFTGRADTQIKLRGHRIEAGEIEATLLAHPDITQAAVVLREDQPGDQRLVAYVVATTETTPDTLHQHLTRHLPDHMIPSAVITLTDLPRTTNGKLDRAALPAPEHPATGPTEEAAMPKTPTEQTLCDLFAEVLNVPAVGVDDNFFTLGGHSLLAIRLVAKARAALDTDLTLTHLFLHPTVADLAAAVDAADAAPAAPRPRLTARQHT